MAAPEPRAGDHRQPQGGAAVARRDEGEHGGADPPLQALHRRDARARGRVLRRDRASERRVRHLSRVRRLEQAVPVEDPRAGLPAPRGDGRDVARAHDRRRRRDHRHDGHRVRRDRSMNAQLSAESLQRIDREVAKYPPERRQSAVMAALIIAQDEHGWLGTETMDFVAQYLGMAPVAVYEVASFYTMYNTQPTGKYKLTICTCLPCGLQGALDAADHLRDRLGIDFNETTPDGRFTLKEGECMGAGAMAPVGLVDNKKMHDYLSNQKIDALLEELGKK